MSSRFWDRVMAAGYLLLAILGVLYVVDVQASMILAQRADSGVVHLWEDMQAIASLVAIAGAMAPRAHLAKGRAVEFFGALLLAMLHAIYLLTIITAKAKGAPPRHNDEPFIAAVWHWPTYLPPLPYTTVAYCAFVVLIVAARAVWCMTSRDRLIVRPMTEQKVKAALDVGPTP